MGGVHRRAHCDILDKTQPRIVSVAGPHGHYYFAHMIGRPVDSNFLERRTFFRATDGTWLDSQKPAGDAIWRFHSWGTRFAALRASQHGLRIAANAA